MIDAEHQLEIRTGIADVWDYVQDMQQWALSFPGCQECVVIDDFDSHWIIKVGVGGLVREVKVLVHVDEWAGPERVNFSFGLETEPVVGKGSYAARALDHSLTEVALALNVEGSGSMAPMWEAMCRPLLPELAKSFARELKADIEDRAGVAVKVEKPPFFRRIALWLRRLFRSLLPGD